MFTCTEREKRNQKGMTGFVEGRGRKKNDKEHYSIRNAKILNLINSWGQENIMEQNLQIHQQVDMVTVHHTPYEREQN